MSVPLSHQVVAARLPLAGRSFDVEAEAEECAALAVSLGIHAVETIAATLTLMPMGTAAVVVRGQIRARVVQTDVVTLEPVTQVIEEEVDVTLVPAEEPRRSAKADDTRETAEVAQDTFQSGRIDLGAIIGEHVALALDPYPRGEGVEFEPHVEDAPGQAESAFAALAALKRGAD